ncbi:MAG: outer-membrane lipoprotein carrier protein LolA, partial [Calditrichia bacterium]
RFKLTGLENEIFGTLWMSQDNKFRLETEDQIIVSNGEVYWRYNKLDNQVLIDYAKKSQQDVFLNNFLFHIADLYYSQVLSEEKEDNQKVYELKLTPRNPDESFFSYIKVWIVDKSWDLKRVTYVDYNDNESEYKIEKLVIDPKLPPDIFQFKIPQGIDVVDLRS